MVLAVHSVAGHDLLSARGMVAVAQARLARDDRHIEPTRIDLDGEDDVVWVPLASDPHRTPTNSTKLSLERWLW